MPSYRTCAADNTTSQSMSRSPIASRQRLSGYRLKYSCVRAGGADLVVLLDWLDSARHGATGITSLAVVPNGAVERDWLSGRPGVVVASFRRRRRSTAGRIDLA